MTDQAIEVWKGQPLERLINLIWEYYPVPEKVGQATRLAERVEREGLLAEGLLTRNPDNDTTRVDRILKEVLAAHEGRIGTHWDTCYRAHAGCLALLVRDELNRKGAGRV